ncbi:MAG: hypothetical protein IPI67_38245 [Myxococcales bacterium]|nr:hypothetical protein [Myxococcales bacterium]
MKPLLRLGLGVLAAGTTLCVTQHAFAEGAGPVGSRDSLVLSLEHLGGYSYQRVKPESGDATTNHQFGLFTPFLGPFGSHSRIGVHYFVAPPVSIGALLSYSDNDNFGTFMLFGARVGVALPMSGSTSLWLRGGIAYARTELSFGSFEQTYTGLVPGGEVLLALKPLEHFGFLVGGMFETTLGGKAEVKSELTSDQSQDFSQTEAAFTLGAFIEF